MASVLFCFLHCPHSSLLAGKGGEGGTFAFESTWQDLLQCRVISLGALCQNDNPSAQNHTTCMGCRVTCVQNCASLQSPPVGRRVAFLALRHPPSRVAKMASEAAGTASAGAVHPFHLAIPVHDLAAGKGKRLGVIVRIPLTTPFLCTAKAFYGGVLGCAEGRSSSKWQDYSLYGHQLVCHFVSLAACALTRLAQQPGGPCAGGREVPWSGLREPRGWG